MRLDGQSHVERHRAGRALEGEVPDAPLRPREQRFLTEDQGRRAQELAALVLGRVVFDASQLVQRSREPCMDAPSRRFLEKLHRRTHAVRRGRWELRGHSRQVGGDWRYVGRRKG